MGIGYRYTEVDLAMRMVGKDGLETMETKTVKGYKPVDKRTREERAPGLTVHKEIGREPHVWKVTHDNSGMGLSGVGRATRELAFKQAIMLAEGYHHWHKLDYPSLGTVPAEVYNLAKTLGFCSDDELEEYWGEPLEVLYG